MIRRLACAVGLLLVASYVNGEVIQKNLTRALANSLYCQLAGCTMTGNLRVNALIGVSIAPVLPVDISGIVAYRGINLSMRQAGAFPGFLLENSSTSGSVAFTENTGLALYFRADTGGTFVSTDQKFAMDQAGTATFASAALIQIGSSGITTPDTFLRRRAAATWQVGAADAASPVAQTLAFQGSRGATDTNVAAPVATIQSALGTGNAAGAQVSVSRALMQASGTTQHVAAHAVTVCESKTLSNTSATTTTIATIGLASNSAGGMHALITLTATDGTNFDSETQDVTVSFVNKATVITVGTALITTSTAANNSGSATIGATVTGASPTISLKVTPVFTTIVPSTVTSYVEIFTHGAGAVACQ